MGRKARAVAPDVAADTRGNFVRNLGWKQDQQGGFKQPRFYLGRHRADAMVRAGLLEQIWGAVERRWVRLGRQTPRAVWDEISLQIAHAVAHGDQVCRLVPPPRLFFNDVLREPQEHTLGVTFDISMADPEYLVSWLRHLQADFPMVRLALADEKVQAEGEAMKRQAALDLIEEGKRLLRKNTPRTIRPAPDPAAIVAAKKDQVATLFWRPT